MYPPSAYYVPTISILCTHHQHTMYPPSAYYVPTISILCTHHQHTMFNGFLEYLTTTWQSICWIHTSLWSVFYCNLVFIILALEPLKFYTILKEKFIYFVLFHLWSHFGGINTLYIIFIEEFSCKFRRCSLSNSGMNTGQLFNGTKLSPTAVLRHNTLMLLLWPCSLFFDR